MISSQRRRQLALQNPIPATPGGSVIFRSYATASATCRSRRATWPAGGLESCNDNLAIRDRLAKSDPGSAGWQRHLSMSYAKLASILRKKGGDIVAIDNVPFDKAPGILEARQSRPLAQHCATCRRILALQSNRASRSPSESIPARGCGASYRRPQPKHPLVRSSVRPFPMYRVL
jgi:hypothetical protein